MAAGYTVPKHFDRHLQIDNAGDRLEEALEVAKKVTDAGVSLVQNMDHAAIFADPPHLLAGPLKKIGYVAG